LLEVSAVEAGFQGREQCLVPLVEQFAEVGILEVVYWVAIGVEASTESWELLVLAMC
jgi:hypothetical protein